MLDTEAGLRRAEAAAGSFAELLALRRTMPSRDDHGLENRRRASGPLMRVVTASHELTAAIQAAVEPVSPHVAEQVRQRVQIVDKMVRAAAAARERPRT